MKQYYLYAEDVLSGKIITGRTIKLACKRFQDDLLREELTFREDKVDRAINFISTLKHYTGAHSGKPFILLGWQQFIVANLVGFYWAGTNHRRFTSSYIEVSRKNGKALALDTKIPTTNGWTTMGDLKVGDTILGADGKPTKVTFVTPTMFNHNCYRVAFEDGEAVIADAEHNWYVKNNGKESVKTTELIYKSKWKKESSRGSEYYYRVPQAKPVELPDIDLPIDPYVLGVWLGDGTTNKPNFTVSIEDLQMYDRIKEIYGDYKVRLYGNTLDLSFSGDKGKDNSKLRHDLISAAVFGNKHIPAIYLRASKWQRLQLLKGLMDTDGTVSKSGLCEFVQKSEEVSDGICELLSTLGIKYTRTIKIPTCNGKQCDQVQRISFFTDKSLPCFTLPRKLERLKDLLSKRMLWKSIVNIEPVESVPVRCITVDNPDHLYLFGDRFTVTHNTALAAALCLYFLIADGEDGAEVLLAANSKDLAKIAFEMCSKFSKGLDPKGKYLTCYRADILFPMTGSKLKVLAADDTKLDGFNASFGLLDKIFVHVKLL